MTTRTRAEEHALLAVARSLTEERDVGDGGFRNRAAIGSHVRRIVAVELTTAVALARLVDREPVVATAVPTLVVVEAVVAHEAHCQVIHFNCAAEELDAIIFVRNDFNVVNGGA